MTRILVIGSTWEQLPLIKAAKKRGYYVVTTNPLNTKTDARGYADITFGIDSFDLDGYDKIFDKFQPDAIVSDACDYSNITWAYLAGKYNLKGPSIDSALIGNNKLLQRQIGLNSGIQQPRFAIVRKYEDAIKAAKEIGYPVMVKSVNGRGGIGSYLARTKTDLYNSFHRAITLSREILIEEHVDGYMVTIDGIVLDNHINLLHSKKNKYDNNPMNANQLEFPGNINSIIETELYKTNNSLMHHMGFDFGLTHTEYVIKDDELYFLETHNRGCGVLVASKIINYVRNINVANILLDLSLGNSISINDVRKINNYVILHFFDWKPGRVNTIVGIDKVKSMENVLDFHLNLGIENIIRNPIDASFRPGFVIVKGSSLNECNSIINEIENTIKINYNISNIIKSPSAK